VLQDFIDQVEPFMDEICHAPTRGPTKGPTPDHRPTEQPTPEPTDEPTPRPIPEEPPICTCRHLGYELEEIKQECSDWDGNIVDCDPGCADICDYNLHCFTYKVDHRQPDCESHECDYQDENGMWHPHTPEYIVFPHRRGCKTMNFAAYLRRVYSVKAEVCDDNDDGYCYSSNDPDDFAYYDSDPDPLSTATGLKIPIFDEWDEDGNFQFEVCLVGGSTMVEPLHMDVGWSYEQEYFGLKETWDYGYTCDNNIALPDLCGPITQFYIDENGKKCSYNDTSYRPLGMFNSDGTNGNSNGNGNGNGYGWNKRRNRTNAFFGGIWAGDQ